MLYPFIGEEGLNSLVYTIGECPKGSLERVYFTFYSEEIVGQMRDT